MLERGRTVCNEAELSNRSRPSWWRTLATTSIFVLVSTGAAAADEKIRFDIEAQSTATALVAYAQQADVQLAFPVDDLEDARARRLVGEYDKWRALEILIEGTDLTINYGADDTVTLQTVGPVSSVGVVSDQRSNWRLAQVGSAQQGQPDTRDEDSERQSTDNVTTLEQIIVTGTHIRGTATESSPSFSYNREDIARTGVTTTQQFVQTLVPNFSGGSNETFLGAPNDNASQENLGFGSSVNLRGLGSGSTLVLLNGRRLAPSSAIGDFVDISMIPLNAIERVDVLTDGASAIYGGDAVAGVVNFVLRDDFDGAETLVQIGSVTEGELFEYRVGQTIGETWGSGNALLTYDFYDRGNLSADDRSFTQGTNLPFDLLPDQTRHSVLLSANQELTSGVSIHFDGLYSNRDSLKFTTATEGNTFRDEIDNEQYAMAVDVEIDMPGDWVLETGGGYSEVSIFVDRSINNISQERVASSQWTLDALASGSILRVPAGDLKGALGLHFRREKFSNFDVDRDLVARDAGRDVFAAFFEVYIPLVSSSNNVPAVDRLEINFSGRYEDYSDFGSTYNPKVGLLWSPIEGLSFRGSYGTSFNPPDLGRVGAVDTVLNAFTNDITNSFFNFANEVPNSSVALLRQGTSDTLDAEESRTWTVGIDLDWDVASGQLSLSGTYFDVEFEGRINDPVVPGGLFNVLNLFLSGSDLIPPGLVVENPSADQVSTLIQLAEEQSGFNDFFGVFAGFDNVGFIVNFVDDNRARTRVNGIEWNAEYNVATDYGDLVLSITSSYLLSFETQNSVVTPPVDVVGTVFNPADLKLRGGLSWSDGGWAVSVFANHTGSYTDDRPSPTLEVDAYTTVDLNVGYRFEKSTARPLLGGLSIGASVLNLFDQNPPRIESNPNFGVLGFDPTNASALGRFVTLYLRKEW